MNCMRQSQMMLKCTNSSVVLLNSDLRYQGCTSVLRPPRGGPDTSSRFRLGQNLQRLGVVGQRLGLCLSLGLERFVHIPCFASCNSACTSHNEMTYCDRHLDVHTARGVKMIPPRSAWKAFNVHCTLDIPPDF